MSILRKNKPDNWIIKLIKITDKVSADKFDMEGCILALIDSITQYTNIQATHFDINYKSSRKTLNGFIKELKKQKELVYSFVGFDSKKTSTYFVIDNPMLNWTEKPDNSSVDICIQIASNMIASEKVDIIANGLIKGYDFDYGYITKLPWNFDAGSERKLKRGLFSVSAAVNEIDHAWTFHQLGVIEGFIKRIYPINYLNDSHLKSLKIKELLSDFGTTEKVTQDISKWTLDSKEIEQLKINKIVNEISIITSGLDFLRTDRAKVINDKMKLRNASC